MNLRFLRLSDVVMQMQVLLSYQDLLKKVLLLLLLMKGYVKKAQVKYFLGLVHFYHPVK